MHARRTAIGATVIFFSALTQAPVQASAPAAITLRGMGSFHIGGREVTLSGRPVKEVVLTPGGVPAKVIDYYGPPGGEPSEGAAAVEP